MQVRVSFNEADEGLELLVFVLPHALDELVDAGIAQADGVVAHYLEGTPAGRLIGAYRVDHAGLSEALMFASATDVAAWLGVDQ
ncbi:hypothetical protein D3C75_1263290 [compost metagenome]